MNTTKGSLAVLVSALIAAGCSGESGDSSSGGPAGGSADPDAPFVTGSRTQKVPKGHAAKFQMGETSHTFAYSHITVSQIGGGAPNIAIECVPTGKKVPPDQESTLYFYWSPEKTKPASWDELDGLKATFEPGTLALITIKGKTWTAMSVTLSLKKGADEAFEAAFEGTYLESVDGDEPGPEVKVKGTIKAYRGTWSKLELREAGGRIPGATSNKPPPSSPRC